MVTCLSCYVNRHTYRDHRLLQLFHSSGPLEIVDMNVLGLLRKPLRGKITDQSDPDKNDYGATNRHYLFGQLGHILFHCQVLLDGRLSTVCW